VRELHFLGEDDSDSSDDEEDALSEMISANMHAFDMLFNEYRVWWWEVFESGRRLTLTGFLVLCGPGTSLQTLVAILVSLVAYNVFTTTRPMVTNIDNVLSERAQLATLVILIFMVILRNVSSETTSDTIDILMILISSAVPLGLTAQLVSVYRGVIQGYF